MNNFFTKIDRFINKVIKYLIVIYIALVMLVVNLSVLPDSGAPDWLAIIICIIFIYMYVKRSKIWSVIINLLIDLGIFILGHGIEDSQQIFLELWENTLSPIIACGIVIGIIYLICKSGKR